jgi:glucans biosynthesis protein C
VVPQRQYALDNLRALMMWLGIVLHVAANHITGPMQLPWRDKVTSETADVLVAVIHVFRMPLFLILSGFFVALLVDRRGPHQMLQHRMRRIALPFVLFWPVLFPLMGLLAMLYAFRAERGYFGLSLDVVPTVPHAPFVNTMHLWFLYQLAGLVLLTFATLKLYTKLPTGLRHLILLVFHRLSERPWGALALAFPLGLIGAQSSFGVLTVTGSFMPPMVEWIHHGLFYAFGYLLYIHRDGLLPLYTARAHHFLWSGGLLCLASLGVLKEVQMHPEDHGLTVRILAAWAYNAATWLWSFAFIGLALRHLNRPSRTLQYLSDSSYWSYLVHMLGTIGFGALLYGADLSAEAKMLFNVAATTLFCLVTYQVLVRNSAIGEFLNGRRHASSKATHVIRTF